MFICFDNLYDDAFVKCSVNQETLKPIEAGLKCFEQEFGKDQNMPDGRVAYYQYGVERVGLACGYKYFGAHDWYKETASTIINSQKEDGSWGNTCDTAYSLLF